MTGGSYRTDCVECTDEIAASSKFCPSCGERQPWLTDDRDVATDGGTATDGTEYVGWFEALGNPVPEDQREQAVEEARKMGMAVSDDSPWVNEVADLVEQDRPKEAIETARVHLDLTGTYRFLAALCVPVESKVQPEAEREEVPSLDDAIPDDYVRAKPLPPDHELDNADCHNCGEPWNGGEGWDERHISGGASLGEDWYYTCPGCGHETFEVGI